jgi:hypothetical protein
VRRINGMGQAFVADDKDASENAAPIDLLARFGE